MYTKSHKRKDNTQNSVANTVAQKKTHKSVFQFVDNRFQTDTSNISSRQLDTNKNTSLASTIQLSTTTTKAKKAAAKKAAAKKKAAKKAAKNLAKSKREVLNLVGTSHLKSHLGKSWKNHYTTKLAWTKCCVSGCASDAEVGAHVKFKIGKGRKNNRYIAPFCQFHNKRPDGTVLGLKEGTKVVGVGAGQPVESA